MDPIQRIQANLRDLTRAEQRAAQYILQDPAATLAQNLTALAQSSGTSNAAVIRMCRKLGYNGYSEFKFSLNRYLLSHGTEEAKEGEEAADPAQVIIDTYARYLRQVPEFVSPEQFRALAGDIAGAGHIDIWGVNRTAQSAHQLSNRLTRLGIYNKVVEDAIVMNDDSNILTKGDVCILFSMRGRGSANYGQMLENLRERGCATWLITMKPDLDLIKLADHTIRLPWISHDNKANFFEDQIVVYLFIELLLHYVVELYPG